MSEKLSGKTAIVTGGAGGIGAATAKRFASEGAALVIADRDGAGAERIAGDIIADGGCAIASEVDLREPVQIDAMLAKAKQAFGRIHVLVNNAGQGAQAHFLETTMETWTAMIENNLTGTFLCSQAVARGMAQEGGGRIVNIASHSGLLGSSGRAAYAAAKGGIIALTRVMAVDLAEYRITVNCIAPGPIDTPRIRNTQTEERQMAWHAAVPLGRYGEPDEIAGVAAFLASDDASYMTGQTLAVDGGFTAAGLRVKQV
jgi:NAD(P)-dependent dehydrogenase (short-subunit alcohol dehydrogenase family)